MSKKEIKPLSETFLKAFDSKASRVEKQVVSEATEVQILESKLSDVTRQINAARIGGVGNIGKLSEEKARLQLALQEAYGKKTKKEALDPVGKADADIDNDGDVDKSDEYLHNRRKAIKKAIAKEEVELEEKLAPHTVRGDTYVGVPDRVVAQAKEKVKKMNPSNASDHTKAMHKALSDMGWEMTVSGKYVKESVELEEQRQPFIVIDTADGNKVVGTASDEKGAKSIISSSERPPMSIKDKSTLKIVKSRKKQHIGHPIQEDVEITELHMALLEAHGIEKKVAERVKKVFDAMSTEDKAAFMKAYLKNPKAATEHMFGSMKKMAKEEVELEEDVRKMSNSRLKFHMNNKNVPHGSYSWDEMKAERDRRLKTGGAEAYKKAKMSMSEEIELDEAKIKVGDIVKPSKSSAKTMKVTDIVRVPYMGRKETFVNGIDDQGNKLRRPLRSVVKEEVELEEGYTINHKTFSSAVQHAKAQVEKQGYTIDDDEWDRKVAMGPKKPGTGKTNRYTIDLMKGGKETRRKLQMQVYYDEGRYELNMYVS